MRCFFHLLLVCVFAVAGPGCAVIRRRWKKEPDPHTLAQSRRPLARVGVIAMVDATEGFVLIDSGATLGPAVDTRLLSYTGTAQSAQLRASTVRRRPFLVAEILDGVPRRGDEVYEASTEVSRPEPR